MTGVWDHYKHRLIGGWRAISYELRESDSPNATVVAKPHGDKPLGRAVITPHGFLSAHLAIPERLTSGPLPSGKPWQMGEDKEVAWVARGLSMYCGYLKLYQEESKTGGEEDGEEGLWWETTVEVCSDPARYGGKERRKVRFVKDNRDAKHGGELMELRPFQDLVTEVRVDPEACVDADKHLGWKKVTRRVDLGEI